LTAETGKVGRYRGSRAKILIGLSTLGVIILALVAFWLLNQRNVLATVNNEVINKGQLYQKMYAQIGPQALEEQINQKLIQQEGEKLGIKVTPEEIQAEIEKLKGTLGVSTDEELQTVLQQYQMTGEDLEQEIITWQMASNIIASTIEINEDEMQQYFTEHQEEYAQPEQVHARHILAGTEAEAASLLEKLHNGADFAELAREKSTDPGSKEQGGDLGFIKKGDTVAEFEQAAFSLKEGEISNVVKTEHGYHLIQALEKKEAVQPEYQDVKNDVENKLREQKIAEEYPVWLQELRDKADIQYKIPH